MYLESHIGKAVLVATKAEWSDDDGNTARYYGPPGPKSSSEVLVGVDHLGIWIEREPGYHKLVPGRSGVENRIKLHILIPWSEIEHLAVVVEGIPTAGPDGLVLADVRKEIGFHARS